MTTACDSDVGDCGDAVVGLSQTKDTLTKSCSMTVMTHPHAWLQDLVRQFTVLICLVGYTIVCSGVPWIILNCIQYDVMVHYGMLWFCIIYHRNSWYTMPGHDMR